MAGLLSPFMNFVLFCMLAAAAVYVVYLYRRGELWCCKVLGGPPSTFFIQDDDFDMRDFDLTDYKDLLRLPTEGFGRRTMAQAHHKHCWRAVAVAGIGPSETLEAFASISSRFLMLANDYSQTRMP